MAPNDTTPTTSKPDDSLALLSDEELIQELEDELTDDYDQQRRSSVETAALWNDLGNLCRDAGRFEQAHCYYHKALELSRKQLNEETAMDYSTHSNSSSSSSSSSSGGYDSEDVSSSSSSSEGLSASVWGNLGLVASDMGKDDEARSHYLKALEDLTQLAPSQQAPGPRGTTTVQHNQDKLRLLNVARTYNNLGSLYSKQGNYTIARKYFDQALDQYSTALLSSNASNSKRRSLRKSSTLWSLPDAFKTPDVAFCFHNLGNLCMDVGKFEEAAVHLETALQIHQHTARTGGDASARTATLETLGELCVELGRYAKAIEYYQQVLELQQLQLANNDNESSLLEDLERTQGILGVLCFELGRYPSAKSHFQRVLDLHQKGTPNSKSTRDDDSHEDMAGTLDYLARVEHKLGHPQLARSYREQSLRLLQVEREEEEGATPTLSLNQREKEQVVQ